MKKVFLLILLLVLVTGCQKSPAPKKFSRAFYYWKSIFSLSPFDIERLNTLQIRRLYVKFFDVTWDDVEHDAIPIASIRFGSPIPERIGIVPTVFITNETLQNVPIAALETLAENIVQKVKGMYEQLALTRNFQEIQLDCDWTDTTRVKYFILLDAIAKRVTPQKVLISATIRLHQIKYHERTGVPPVNRGMLMCYNMGSPRQPDLNNAILDVQLAKQYLDNLEQYPLALDIALPIFSWGVLFKDRHFIKLLNGLRKQDLQDHTQFESVQGNIFLARENTYVGNHYIYKGERIRIDEIRAEECREIVEFVGSRVKNSSIMMTLFHYDRQTVQHYTFQELESIFSDF